MTLRILVAALLSMFGVICCNTRTLLAAPAYAPGPSPPVANGTSLNKSNIYVNLPEDVAALKSIFDDWSASNINIGSILPGWSSDGLRPCIDQVWQGVICYFVADHYDNTTNKYYYNVSVIGLSITNTDLKGDLPPAIGNLTQLTTLTITGNPQLSGNLPVELGKLTTLNILDLHSNAFSGRIPSEIGLIPNLVSLDLSDNNLTGEIPKTLGNITYLTTLQLSRNQLSGAIPTSSADGNLTDRYGLDKLQYLIALNLMENNLGGPLPDLRSLGKLQLFNVSDNQLSGPLVLNSIFNASANISLLDLSSNKFTGPLPDVTSFSANLQQLGLGDNLFDSSGIPSWIQNLTHLKTLELANISLFGDVPAFLFNNSTSLEYIFLERNSLNGTLYLDTFKPGNLRMVNLTENDISNVVYNQLLVDNYVSTVVWLKDNPYCNERQSRPDNDLEKSVFCGNSTASRPVYKIADKYRKPIITAVIIVSLLFLLMATVAIIGCCKNRREKRKLLQHIQQEFAKQDVQPTLYAYNELRAYTRDFREDMKLGQGGFGVVYKGVQPDGSELAVKQLLGKSQHSTDEFLNEVLLITGVRHRNLVKLKGCCLTDDKRLLVYEYVENNNLAEVLFDGRGEHDLTWEVRYNICLGVSQGLQYLHENAQPRIIHRDIKAPNILLDKNLNAKIADFGLARLFPDEESHITTLHIAGTMGYMAPEYASQGQLTEKADVYSFGVLVLEIVSGRKNIEGKLPVEEIYLVEWAWRLHEEGRILELVDPTMNIHGHEADVGRVLNTAMLCVQATGTRRPSMARAVSMIKGEMEAEVVMRQSLARNSPLYESYLATAASGSYSTVDMKPAGTPEIRPRLEASSSNSSRLTTPSGVVELTSVNPR